MKADRMVRPAFLIPPAFAGGQNTGKGAHLMHAFTYAIKFSVEEPVRSASV